MEALRDLKPANMEADELEMCLPGTRVDILQNVFVTLTYPNVEKNVIWLRGPAGTGKSTILNTLAHYSLQLCRQGAFLFWDRNDPDNSEPRRVIRTLAYLRGNLTRRSKPGRALRSPRWIHNSNIFYRDPSPCSQKKATAVLS
jgi:hypothetical protein